MLRLLFLSDGIYFPDSSIALMIRFINALDDKKEDVKKVKKWLTVLS
jgi:hypothetical protein